MIKEKLGNSKGHNHFVNNPRGMVITPKMVLGQVEKYNKIDAHGHLYGAIISSFRDYLKKKETGKYGEYHPAFCAHYVANLSQPLHNIEYTEFNRKYHKEIDGVVNDEIMESLDKIKTYPVRISSEADLAKEIARISNQAMILGYKLEDEKRLLTKEEAYQQIGHNTSLFKDILDYVKDAKAEK